MQYRREIDGLRAIAVVPVILFHAGAPGFGGGFVGVDVFFVISGFLITGLLLEDLAVGPLSIRRFYERRARRILPALFLVMGASLLPAWSLLSPGDLRDFGRSLLAVPLFGSNLLFWRQSGYFDTASELKPLLHTWSLAVEEQFYLLFPLLLGWLARSGRRRIGLTVAGISIASLLFAEWLVMHAPASAFYLLPSRAWELGLGALLALWHRPPAPGRAHWTSEVAALAGLLMIGMAVAQFDRATPFPGFHALLPTLGTSLVLRWATADTGVGKWLGSRPLVAIGLISYSAYLWHFPLFVFARHATLGNPGLAVLLGLSVASLVLAALSWRFVEQPFRQRTRISQTTLARAAIAGGLVFALAGGTCVVAKGFPDLRLTEAQRAVLRTAVPSPKRQDCHTEGLNYLKPAGACHYFVPRPTWAVFGDSHAVELAYGLAEELRPEADGVAQFSFSGCTPDGVAPMAVTPVPGCAAWMKETVETIARDPGLHRVVVVFRLHAALFGRHEETYPALPGEHTEAERARLWQSYVTLLRAFVAQRKEVFVVLQAPELPKPVGDLIRRARNPQEVPGVSREWWNARAAYVTARLSDLPPEVTIIDPAALLCDDTRCLAVTGGVARYFDDDHYSVAGAREVARVLLSRADRAR